MEDSMIQSEDHVNTSVPQVSESYLFPCSVVQKTCWYLDRMSPGTPANNIAVRFRLEGPLQIPTLEEAIKQVVARHEVLRTRFVMSGDEPQQLVEAEARFPLAVIDLRELPENERVSEVDRLSSEEARIGFDLEHGPLFRGKLLRVANEDCVLLLTMHHIISDGWSIGIVTDEMGRFYQALQEGGDSGLAPLTIQYADYACWQQHWTEQGELNQQVDALKSQLDGFAPIFIPTDFERPVSPFLKGEIRSRVLPRTLTDAIKRFSDQQGCTLFVSMLSAFAALMVHEARQTDLAIRTQVSGRDQLELEPLIGWFVNSIILRIDSSGSPAFNELVERARAVVLDSMKYQHVPFERLMSEIQPTFTYPRQLPFQVNFIFQRDFVRPWERAGLKMTAIPSKSTGTFVDLNFFLVERADGWRASVDVNTDVFDPKIADHLLENYSRILEAVVARPTVRLEEIELKVRDISKANLTALSVASSNAFVPARNKHEQEVIEIWERVLKVNGIGALTNFFDVGGNSLSAVRMLVALREKFGRDIKLSELFADPSPAAMSFVISGEIVAATPQDIIPVQPKGNRTPFFMFGGGHFFRSLAKGIGEDQPFLGVSLEKYRDADMPADYITVPLGARRLEVARELAGVLMDRYGNGPFYLGGWCADGITAYETARVIEERGGIVAIAALIDAINPQYYTDTGTLLRSAANTMEVLKDTLACTFRNGLKASVSAMAKTVSPLMKRARDRIAVLHQYKLHHAATAFPLLVLRPAEIPIPEHDLGWQRTCHGEISVVEIPGDHSSLFREPNLSALAQQLRKHLDLAMARALEPAASNSKRSRLQQPPKKVA
jgi:thioesterase domain-containing protein/acyl carrier protein